MNVQHQISKKNRNFLRSREIFGIFSPTLPISTVIVTFPPAQAPAAQLARLRRAEGAYGAWPAAPPGPARDGPHVALLNIFPHSATKKMPTVAKPAPRFIQFCGQLRYTVPEDV